MTFKEHIESRFRIVITDTEFQFDESMSYPKKVLCTVYKDLSTGEIFRVWEKDQMSYRNNLFDFENTLFVCFTATAEAGSFMKLHYGRPINIFDCWTEYSKLFRNQRPLSMLAAAAAYKVKNLMSVAEKEANRDLIIKQDTWTADEQKKIMEYCQRDVEQTEEIFYGILRDLEEHCGDNYELLLDQALARGQFMACVAKVQLNGIPLDLTAVNDFNYYWDKVKHAVIQRVNKKINLWDEKSKFSYEKFNALIKKLDLWEEWPRTPKGKLKIKDETLRIFKTFNEIQEFRRVKNLLDKAKLAEYIISEDNRYRPNGGFRPFSSHTGRCYPSSKWIFGTSKWGRNFITPSYGNAIIYLDYRSEEPFVAAQLSGDHVLLEAYNTGDFYLGTAKLAGLAPDNATKATHGETRNIFKVLSLAVFYDMGLRSVVKSLKKFEYSRSQAAGLLQKFKEQYKITFAYMDQYRNDAAAYGSIHTRMGWSRFFPTGAIINPKSVQNWSIQAESAEVLRNALIRLINANIKVCAMVQDAFLIECPIPEVEDQIRIAKQCMVHAARHVVGGTIDVEHETHYGNFKQGKKDQEVFDMIFEEISKYKTEEKKLLHGQVSSQNMVRSPNYYC